MDRYTKTGLRLNKSTPPFPQGASRPAPTSTEEQALLFLVEPQPDSPPDNIPAQEPPALIRKKSETPKRPKL